MSRAYEARWGKNTHRESQLLPTGLVKNVLTYNRDDPAVMAMILAEYQNIIGGRLQQRCKSTRSQRMPTCPDCGAQMRKRKGTRGDFYGCVRYPDCTGSVDCADQVGDDPSYQPIDWVVETLQKQQTTLRDVQGELKGLKDVLGLLIKRKILGNYFESHTNGSGI